MPQTLKILFPWDGDFVNSRDGEWKDNALWIPVSVSVSAVVNGIPTKYNAAQNCHVGSRDFWMDTQEDMVFGRIDRVLNIGTPEENRNAVLAAAEDPHRGGFVSLMIHEQYFYKDYVNYLVDFETRVLEGCRLLYERGYRGRLISDVVREDSLQNYPGLG